MQLFNKVLAFIFNVVLFVLCVAACILFVWLAVKLWQKFNLTGKCITPVWSWLNSK